ncbi:hypothetical protein GCM10010211_59240 [Streptomyces albospinus]|uniref:Transposase n=1 Tax=Streptomyces albospinus TaxID=285515 RepID=A0ABQ2VJA7_9ACTN|nr:hypothetical protein GCM10010211_59240 [Streptomyces albospinus]
MTRKLIDRSAWHHADGWRLYGVSGVRSNTIRATRPDVSVTEPLDVKGAQRTGAKFRGYANRLKGYVRGELRVGRPEPLPGRVAHATGRALSTRPGRLCGIDARG